MSHAQILFNAIKGLVSNRCYPDVYPQAPNVIEWPAIRYTQIGGTVFNSNCNPSSETDATQFQIDIGAKTASQRETLMTQVRDALDNLNPPVELTTSFITGYDTESKVFTALVRIEFAESSAK